MARANFPFCFHCASSQLFASACLHCCCAPFALTITKTQCFRRLAMPSSIATLGSCQLAVSGNGLRCSHGVRSILHWPSQLGRGRERNVTQTSLNATALLLPLSGKSGVVSRNSRRTLRHAWMFGKNIVEKRTSNVN